MIIWLALWRLLRIEGNAVVVNGPALWSLVIVVPGSANVNELLRFKFASFSQSYLFRSYGKKKSRKTNDGEEKAKKHSLSIKQSIEGSAYCPELQPLYFRHNPSHVVTVFVSTFFLSKARSSWCSDSLFLYLKNLCECFWSDTRMLPGPCGLRRGNFAHFGVRQFWSPIWQNLELRELIITGIFSKSFNSFSTSA